MKQRASNKGLRLTIETEPGLTEWVSGDVTRYRQILLNLVHNAIKFTPSGGVVINASSSPLEGEVHEITTSVKDTGMGIPKSALG